MTTLGDLIYRVGANVDGFEKSMTTVSKRLNKLDRQTSKSISGFTKMGTNLSDVGSRISVGVTLPLFAAAGAAFKFSTDFNASMANVSTLIPGNVARVQELKAAVRDMSVDVGKRTGDLADGLYQVVSAFGDTADTVQILETNARAAAAGLATTTDAINLTSAVTKGYGDVSAEAVEKASDLAFQTVKLGQTTFPELAASIGNVIPIAASLGVAQEELFAGFATLTGVTGGASEVSTQLRGVLAAMIKPTKEMAAAIEGLGFASADAMIKELGMVGAVDALTASAGGNKEQIGKMFGRVEALNAVLALTGGQAETFTVKLDAMRQASGATDEAFKEQTEGINKTGFLMKQVAAEVEVLAQRFGDALAPALGTALQAARPLIDVASSLAKWFSELPEPIQTTVVGVAALAAAVGPLTFVLGQSVLTMTSLCYHWGLGVSGGRRASRRCRIRAAQGGG